MEGRGRRNAILVGLGACQVGVAALAAVFHLAVRPAIAEAVGHWGGAVDAGTTLALSGWLVPAAASAGMVAAIVALAIPMKRSRRVSVMATGVVVAALTLVFAVLVSVRYVLQAT